MKLLGTLIVTKVKIEKGSIDTRRSDRLYQHPLAYCEGHCGTNVLSIDGPTFFG